MMQQIQARGAALGRACRLWPAALLFLAGMGYYCVTGLHKMASIPGDLGDTRLNIALLEHVFQWLTGRAGALWSPAFFFPYPDVLGFSDNHLGTVWGYAGLRLLGLDREHALIGWFLLGTALNYWAAYWAARRLELGVLPAAMAGFVFAFALPVMAQDGHVQLSHRYPAPLAFAAFWRFLQTRRLEPLCLAAAAASWQFLCSVYHGIFLVYLLLASLAAFSLVRGEAVAPSPPPSRLRTWAAAALAFAGMAAVALMLAKYRSVSVFYGFQRSTEHIRDMLPRLSSYLLADAHRWSGWVGRRITGIPMRHEHQMFAGFGVLLLAGCGAAASWARSGRRLGRVAALALLLLVLFTLEVEALAPFDSVYLRLVGLPGINALRAVSRIILIMLLPLGLLAGLGASALLERAAAWRPLWRAGLCGLLVLTLCTETLKGVSPTIPLAGMQDRHARLRAQLDAQLPAVLPERPVLYLTPARGGRFVHTEVDGILLAQERGWATLNGYSGNFTPGYQPALQCEGARPRLERAARFLKLSREEIEAMERRVVLVPLGGCDLRENRP